ncbi:MAG: hypothetical protein II251_04180 [Lachnospiraceae bacterium]|nr:hypothetical protein [Lachnospiraceae bacterium]
MNTICQQINSIQYTGQLIDEYKMLKKLYKIAKLENSIQTMEAIEEEANYIKLKLQGVELPPLND